MKTWKTCLLRLLHPHCLKQGAVFVAQTFEMAALGRGGKGRVQGRVNWGG